VLPAEARRGKSFAPPTTVVSTEFGFTKVQLDDALRTEFDTLDITVSRLGPSFLFSDRDDSDRDDAGRKRKHSERRTSVAFSIVGGIFDPVASIAEILHRGGVILSTDDAEVVLSNFIIDLTDSDAPVLTGLVTENGSLVGRVPLFNLDLADSTTSLSRVVLKISDITLTLTDEAASALNSAFEVDAFAVDNPVGEADIIAILRSLNQGVSFEPPKHDDDDDRDHDRDDDDDDDDHDDDDDDDDDDGDDD
jgi:hypothetical protein